MPVSAPARPRRAGLKESSDCLPGEFVHEVVTGHARDSKNDRARTGSVELLIARPDQGEVEVDGLRDPRLAGIAVRLVSERGPELHGIRLQERARDHQREVVPLAAAGVRDLEGQFVSVDGGRVHDVGVVSAVAAVLDHDVAFGGTWSDRRFTAADCGEQAEQKPDRGHAPRRRT